MTKIQLIGYDDALDITLNNIEPADSEMISLANCVNRITSEDMKARVDSPSVNASLKDGYAVISGDIEKAAMDTPVELKLLGRVTPGVHKDCEVINGTALRVLTGSEIPKGADAVLAEEFTKIKNGDIIALNNAEQGRNILPKGVDVSIGEKIVFRGTRLTPGMAGMLAAAGHDQVPVYRNLKIAIIATGDEVIAPGQPLTKGKLYASNLVTLNAWCHNFHLDTQTSVVKDDPDAILNALRSAADSADVILTSGGAWSGDRDLVAHMLNRLGWQLFFHRVRIGPGKGVGFGLLNNKPVFILPGGPPSNLIAFLEIALPGILKLAGDHSPGLHSMNARLASDINGKYSEWTQFIFGTIESSNSELPWFKPLQGSSRLGSMAEAQAIAACREGLTNLLKGTAISVQIL
jgi:molybdopterin molybdotransferase